MSSLCTHDDASLRGGLFTLRQTLSLLAGATLLLGLAGCGGSNDEDDTDGGQVTLGLTQTGPTVSPGGKTNLVVSTARANAAAYVFRWTITGGAATLFEIQLPNTSGRDITTITTGVTLSAPASDAPSTVYTVKVVGTNKDTSETTEAVTTQVTITDDGSVGLQAFAQNYEAASPHDSLEIGVVVKFTHPPAGVTRFVLLGEGPAGSNQFFRDGRVNIPFTNPNFVNAFGQVQSNTVKVHSVTANVQNAQNARNTYHDHFFNWTWQVIAYRD